VFDEDVSFTIEQRFPYPIAVSFRRLETEEYFEAGPRRLKGIFEVAERTAHLLALIVLSDLYRLHQQGAAVGLPRSLAADFRRRFEALAFGTLLAVARDGSAQLAASASEPFVPELAPLFVDQRGKPSPTAQAFDELVTARNSLAHPTRTPTAKELAELSATAELRLATILQALSFITAYEMLSVNQIEVIKRPRQEAQFSHRFSRVVGVSENFRAREERYREFMESQSVVLKRKGSFDHLNLYPLILHSAEGERQVPDVFLYLARKGQGAIYAASHNGGALDSRSTSFQAELGDELDALVSALAGAAATE
jgi:hypothetical protein